LVSTCPNPATNFAARRALETNGIMQMTVQLPVARINTRKLMRKAR
jgi:hypothetical protein